MSQRFSLKMEEMRQASPAAAGSGPEAVLRDDELYYPASGQVRHICFCWPEGKKFFLNYAYLVSGEYEATDQRIRLQFSSHTVRIEGINLEPVFFGIMRQQIRLLSCVETRYNAIEPARAIVNSIEITADA